MAKKIRSSSVILLFVLTLFIVYECSMMFAGVDDMAENITAFGTISTFPILLLLASVLFLILSRNIVKNKVYNNYLVVFLLTYFLTVFWALFYPIESRIVMFSSILPLCFWLIGDRLNMSYKEKTIRFYVPACFVVLAFFFLINFDAGKLLDKEYAAINASYTVVYLLPFVLLSDKRSVRVVAILLAIVITLMSLKRGGMLSLAIGLTVYFIVYGKIASGKNISIKGIIIALIAVISITFLVLYFNNSMEGLIFNRFTSLEQDEGSGRVDIYRQVRGMISDSSIIGYILGHGWGGVARESPLELSAHNDFFEIIFDFGYIAFFLYVVFLVRLFARLFKMLNKNHHYAPAFATSLGIFLANSLVSHIFIYSWYMLLFTFFWGFVVRETNNKLR